MESVRRVDVSELEEGAVLLIDTEGPTYKLIIDKGKDPVGISNGLWSEIDEEEGEESEARRVIATQLQVGKPASLVTAPLRKAEKGPLGMEKIETQPITSIEIYE